MCKLVLSDRQRGELCSSKRILALHSRRLSKTSHQLVKPRKCISPAPRMDVQKTYQSYGNLQKHLDARKHLVRLESESTYDTIKKKWADTCADISGSYLRKETGPSSEVAVDHPVCKIPQGGALKTSKRAIRFTEKVKTHLKRIFLEGEETGKKSYFLRNCFRFETDHSLLNG